MLDVSIIVPVYNAKRYLRQALESLLSQTHRNIEIILVDDGSSDGSYEILKDYSAIDDRIKVFQHNEFSEGAAEARNIGLKNAKAKYVAFMDADDFADENMIEEAYVKAEETGADITLFDAWYYDDNENINFTIRQPLNDLYLPDKDVFSPRDYKKTIFRMTHGAVWGRLFLRDFIERNELVFYSCYYWDDIEFFFVALCLSDKIAVLRKRLMHYRYNANNNQSATFRRHPEIAYKATIEIRKRFEKYGIYEEYRISLLNLLLERAFSILDRLDDPIKFEELFWELKNGKLKEIGAYDLKDDEYVSIGALRKRAIIENSNAPIEYLLQRQCMNSGKYEEGQSKLARATNGVADIFIYGAGIKGINLFKRLLYNPMYRVVGWCDREYKIKGYPVIDPEKITEYTFDFIIIAIADEGVAKHVCDFIISKGVDENKILYLEDIN